MVFLISDLEEELSNMTKCFTDAHCKVVDMEDEIERLKGGNKEDEYYPIGCTCGQYGLNEDGTAKIGTSVCSIHNDTQEPPTRTEGDKGNIDAVYVCGFCGTKTKISDAEKYVVGIRPEKEFTTPCQCGHFSYASSIVVSEEDI